MYRKTRKANDGVTMLEVLIAIFVLLIGITGVYALFPVGVRLSQKSSDDIISAMTAQNALAAIRVQTGLLDRVQPYTGSNTSGDVLGWINSASEGIDGITDQIIDNVGSSAPGDELGLEELEFHPGSEEMFNVKDGSAGNYCALMLITSGNAMWKLYRLDRASSYSPGKVVSTQTGCTNFPADGVKAGDTFRLLGALDNNGVWATAPTQFYANGLSSGSYTLGTGAADNYRYLALINRVSNSTATFRVHILVYKGYDQELPPEGNLPAVACYTTVLSADMLR